MIKWRQFQSRNSIHPSHFTTFTFTAAWKIVYFLFFKSKSTYYTRGISTLFDVDPGHRIKFWFNLLFSSSICTNASWVHASGSFFSLRQREWQKSFFSVWTSSWICFICFDLLREQHFNCFLPQFYIYSEWKILCHLHTIQLMTGVTSVGNVLLNLLKFTNHWLQYNWLTMNCDWCSGWCESDPTRRNSEIFSWDFVLFVPWQCCYHSIHNEEGWWIWRFIDPCYSVELRAKEQQ